MTENEISKVVVDAALKVHRALGPGLLESVYEVVLAHELRGRGLMVQRQVPIPIRYENICFDEAFKADLVVEQKVIVEIKSIERAERVHKKQVLTYLRLADMRLGLLVNFGTELIRDGITRLVNGLTDEPTKKLPFAGSAPLREIDTAPLAPPESQAASTTVTRAGD